MAAGTHHGHAEWRDEVAQGSGFACAQDNANRWKCDTQGAEELNKFTVGEGMRRLEFTSGWAKPGHADCELGLPAYALEVFQMCGKRHCFVAPIGQSKKRSHTEAAESRVVSPLGAIQPPIKILLGPGEVNFWISFAVVCLLINHESLGAGAHDWQVVGGLHRRDFD